MDRSVPPLTRKGPGTATAANPVEYRTDGAVSRQTGGPATNVRGVRAAHLVEQGARSRAMAAIWKRSLTRARRWRGIHARLRLLLVQACGERARRTGMPNTTSAMVALSHRPSDRKSLFSGAVSVAEIGGRSTHTELIAAARRPSPPGRPPTHPHFLLPRQAAVVGRPPAPAASRGPDSPPVPLLTSWDQAGELGGTSPRALEALHVLTSAGSW